MSKLDDKMIQRMIRLVYDEHTNFSYRDFLDLMKPKTYRNKISKLKKEGIVEIDNKSSIAFHTLTGHKFGKAGTRYHKGITISHNDPVYQMIKNLPMDKQSIHDIHLKFSAPGIYEAFLPADFPRIKVNKAIAIPSWCQNNTIVRIMINKNDVVTVIVGCSLEPIPLNYDGIIRFFTILASVEGFLRGLVVKVDRYNRGQNQPITQCGKWIITRWDFGRDALDTYNGKNYEITVENTQNVFARIYTKDFHKYKKIRLEVIESPGKTVIDAIQEKLNLK